MEFVYVGGEIIRRLPHKETLTAMPPKKRRTVVRVNDPELESAIIEYDRYRTMRLGIEKAAEQVKDSSENPVRTYMESILQRYNAEYGDVDVYVVSDFVTLSITRKAGAARLDGSKLIAAGVDPGVIKNATMRTPYNVYTPTVKKPGQSGG